MWPTIAEDVRDYPVLLSLSVEGSGAVSTTKRTLSPVATMTLGAIFLVVGLVIRKGESEAAAARRRERRSARATRAHRGGSRR